MSLQLLEQNILWKKWLAKYPWSFIQKFLKFKFDITTEDKGGLSVKYSIYEMRSKDLPFHVITVKTFALDIIIKVYLEHLILKKMIYEAS